MNRLKQIRESKGYSLAEVAKGLQTTPMTIQRFEAGTRNVSLVWLKKLAGFYNMHVSELVEETATFPDNTSKKLRASERIEIESFGSDTVPILGHANGSTGALLIDEGEEIGRAPRHPNQLGMKGAFAVYAAGESMAPRYRPGELVFVVSNRPPTRGQDCVLELTNGEGFIKEFDRRTDKEIICKQLNPPKEWKRLISEIKAVHAVVGRG